MKQCELVWEDRKACNNLAIKRVKITQHSHIYAGLYEVENKYLYYNVCQRHYDIIKQEKDVLTV